MKNLAIKEKDRIELEKLLIQHKFIVLFEKLRDVKKFKKRDLAESMGISNSYLSQIYSGTRSLNLEILAKFLNNNDCDLNLELIFKEDLRRFDPDSVYLVVSNCNSNTEVDDTIHPEAEHLDYGIGKMAMN